MGEPMTEAEALTRLAGGARVALDMSPGDLPLVATVLVSQTDALAVLLDWHEMGKRATPEQLTALLRGAKEAGRTCPCDTAADSESAAQRYLREYQEEVRELSGQLEKLRAERAAYLYALRTADAAMGAALRGWSKQSADALFHAGLVIREATRHSDDGGELIRGRLYDVVQTEDDYEAFCRSCDWHVLGVETLESAAHLADLHVGDKHFDV